MFRGTAKTRLHGELGKERSHQLVWILACPIGHRSRIKNCSGRFWTRSKAANWHHWSCKIDHLISVDACHGCGLLVVPSTSWTPVTVVKTRRLLDVDIHTDFRTLMKHKAFLSTWCRTCMHTMEKDVFFLNAMKIAPRTNATRRTISCDVCGNSACR